MKNKYSVFWVDIAQKDLNEIIEYIADDSPESALKVFNKIKSKSETLSSFPEKGRIVPELKYFNVLNFRELIVSPWRIVYKIEKQSVYIVAIYDSRRNLEDILLQRVLLEN